MIRYSVGEVIRKERKAQKISQEVLCDGLCTPSWLSKIESGSATPTIALFESLMQRLGKNFSQYVYFKSETEMEIEKLKFNIRSAYATSNIEKAKKDFEKLKSLIKDKDVSVSQFILLYEIILYMKGKDPSKDLSSFKEALKYSIPNFKFENIMNYLLSKDELVILNNIAICTKKIGENDLAIQYFEYIKLYLENPKFDYEEKRRTYPVVLFNLSKLYGQNKDFIKCLSVCNTAIEYCIANNILRVFPDLLYNKGASLLELGINDEGEKHVKQAYYLFKATKNHVDAELCKNYLYNKLSIELD